jgi:hypothetical protein
MNANDKTRRIGKFLILSAALVGFVSATPAVAEYPKIWAAWDNGGTPEEGVHYFVRTTGEGSPDYPAVELRTGHNDWRIWSTDADNPNDIGDMGPVTCYNEDDFGVKILGDSSSPGVRDVKGITLLPDGGTYYTNLIDGYIIGDVEGDLIVQRSSVGTGGRMELVTVDGDVTGDIKAYDIHEMVVLDNILGDVHVDILSGLFEVMGRLGGDLLVADKINADAAVAIVEPDPRIEIDVNDMGALSTLQLGGQFVQNNFGGSLILRSGVPDDVVVFLWGELSSGGTIDLCNQPVAEGLVINFGGGGQILRGGAVTSSGVVSLATGSTRSFSGTASFASLAGHIKTDLDADLDGDVTIYGDISNGGWLKVDGDLNYGGSVKVSGNVLPSTPNVEITIGGDVAGDIDIKGDVNGEVGVGGELKSTGRILVDGLCDGSITIAEETESLSLIHLLEGLDDNGEIIINQDEGAYDANGTIQVGPTSWATLPDIIFDGSILVNDNSLGQGGDLNGAINVVGCHASETYLDICLCGGDGDENIEITQTDCANQVEANCVSSTNCS